MKKKKGAKRKSIKTRSYESESGAEYNARCLQLGILLDTGRRNSEFPLLQLNKRLLCKDRLLRHLKTFS